MIISECALLKPSIYSKTNLKCLAEKEVGFVALSEDSVMEGPKLQLDVSGVKDALMKPCQGDASNPTPCFCG